MFLMYFNDHFLYNYNFEAPLEVSRGPLLRIYHHTKKIHHTKRCKTSDITVHYYPLKTYTLSIRVVLISSALSQQTICLAVILFLTQ